MEKQNCLHSCSQNNTLAHCLCCIIGNQRGKKKQLKTSAASFIPIHLPAYNLSTYWANLDKDLFHCFCILYSLFVCFYFVYFSPESDYFLPSTLGYDFFFLSKSFLGCCWVSSGISLMCISMLSHSPGTLLVPQDFLHHVPQICVWCIFNFHLVLESL